MGEGPSQRCMLVSFPNPYMFKRKEKSELTLEILYRPTISRLFIFRKLWMVFAIWPMAILVVWFGLLSFVHFWHMLILGERSAPIWKHQMRCIRYFALWQAYFKYFVDRRPAFWI